MASLHVPVGLYACVPAHTVHHLPGHQLLPALLLLLPQPAMLQLAPAVPVLHTPDKPLTFPTLV